MKKRVEIDHFKNFRFPSHLTLSEQGKVAFLLKQASVEDNTYYSDLYTLRDQEVVRLTSSRDVNSFWWVGEDLVFPGLRLQADKDAKKKGCPLTVFQRLSLNCGEAEEVLRLKYNVSDVKWLSLDQFYFVASYSAMWNRFLNESEGDEAKACGLLAEEKDYMVFDEIPFWENAVGVTNKVRKRLYFYDHGEVTAISDEFTNVSNVLMVGENKVVFVASRFENKKSKFNRLMMYDASSGQLSDISFPQELVYYHVAAMDDQRLIVDVNDTLRHGNRQNGDHYVYNIVTGEKVLLDNSMIHSGNNTVGSDVKMGNPYSPQWLCTGDLVYFVSTTDDSSHIYVEDVAAKTITQVTRENGNLMEFCFAEGGFLTIAMRGDAGPELYRVSLDGEETCLTGINAALLEEYEVSTPETFTFEDGVGNVLRGWVIKPIGLEEGKKYPTILEVHGGPKTVFGSVYFHEMQLMAAKGYGVIFCNPWGSDGRGSEFCDIRGKYGTIDFDEIMGFVDTCIEKYPWIDGDRLGVAGGSYGGFMTNWIIGHTDRFKAAASQRSISNWVSKSNTSDIGFIFNKDQTGTDAWEDIDTMWWHSPLKYANQVKTPTLFIHSDEDYRCWIGEGIQMFSALKYFGVESRICVFRGENHELSRSGKPRHRIRRLKEIMDWFDQHLQ